MRSLLLLVSIFWPCLVSAASTGNGVSVVAVSHLSVGMAFYLVFPPALLVPVAVCYAISKTRKHQDSSPVPIWLAAEDRKIEEMSRLPRHVRDRDFNGFGMKTDRQTFVNA